MSERSELDRFDDEQDRREGRDGITESEHRHDQELDRMDRLREKGSATHMLYRERPAPVGRGERFDEARVRSLTHPRTGMVQVQPRRCPVDEAA